MIKRAGIFSSAVFALTLVFIFFAKDNIVAQVPPTSQPLVQANDVVYLGIIKIPSGQGLGIGPNGLGVEGNKLYYGCYGGSQPAGVAVLTLPANIGGTATLDTPCANLPNLNQVHKGGTYTDIVPGGILPYGGRVIVTGWTYYDGSGGQVKSHWVGNNTTSINGPYTMEVSDVGMFSEGALTWYRETMVAGYMGLIP
ncbi:MAG: hypothetical protein CEO12_497, partial [Parcubacteria group bacterium Gr01-1014_46]